MKKLVIICALLALGVATAFPQAEEPDSLNLWMIDLEDVVVTAQYAPTDSRSAVHQIRTIRQEWLADAAISWWPEDLKQGVRPGSTLGPTAICSPSK